MCLQMANNLEGGKTPQLPPAELQRLGFKLVAYPLSLLGVSLQGVSLQAMRVALAGIADGRAPPRDALPSFQVGHAAFRSLTVSVPGNCTAVCDHG